MSIFDKIGIGNSTGVLEGVQLSSAYIAQGDTVEARTERANEVIRALGGRKTVTDPDEARICANYMVGQVLEKKTPNYDEAYARCQGLIKDASFFRREGIVFQPTVIARKPKSTYKPKTQRRKGANNNVRKQALELCAANSKLSNAELAQMISKKLKISYSNAYYYSSRVFKR